MYNIERYVLQIDFILEYSKVTLGTTKMIIKTLKLETVILALVCILYAYNKLKMGNNGKHSNSLGALFSI